MRCIAGPYHIERNFWQGPRCQEERRVSQDFWVTSLAGYPIDPLQLSDHHHRPDPRSLSPRRNFPIKYLFTIIFFGWLVGNIERVD